MTWMLEKFFAQGLADIAQYLLMEGAADDGAHAPVAGWLWWALNPNAVDVGGLVSAGSTLKFPNNNHFCPCFRAAEVYKPGL